MIDAPAPLLSTPLLSTPLLSTPFASFAGGLLLGLALSSLFFVGLAWSMQRALRSRHSALVLLSSFALRASLLIGCGLLLARFSQPLYALPAYMLAFLLVRSLAVRHARRSLPSSTTGPATEARQCS